MAVRLAKTDYAEIQELVKAGLYRSSADFLREAVRDKLRTMEAISLQDVDPQRAERMVAEYLEKNPGPSFVSKIADALGIDYGVAFRAVHNLLEKSLIRRAKV